MAARYLEEFTVGQVFDTEPVTLSEADLIAFAERYDPQVMHTDPQGAKDTAYGGLIASGHQTIGTAFAQFIKIGIFAENSLGGPAMDEVRWAAPVRPRDTMVTTAEVLDVRKLPISDVVAMIERGEMTDAISVAAILRVYADQNTRRADTM